MENDLEKLRKSIRAGYRPIIRRPLSDEVKRAFELEEAWDDMVRMAQGKRLLQRLNSSDPARSNRIIDVSEFHTFGGLTASSPPKIGEREIIEGPGISDVFTSERMRRIRDYTPPWPEKKPKKQR